MTLWIGLPLMLLSGCGGGSGLTYTDNSRDTELFAANIKQMIYDVVADARRSREPADSLTTVVDSLQRDPRELPVGEYGDLYEEIAAHTMELHEDCEAIDGRPADLARRLDALIALADQLPGEVKADGAGFE